MTLSFPYDDARSSDTATALPHAHWDSADNWKVNRKGSKVRMVNPASKLAGIGGLTVEHDKLNGMVRIYDGKQVVAQYTEVQIANMVATDNG